MAWAASCGTDTLHAPQLAYLGRELARAEMALRSGGTYVQDAAPERAALETVPACGCGLSCEPFTP